MIEELIKRGDQDVRAAVSSLRFMNTLDGGFGKTEERKELSVRSRMRETIVRLDSKTV